MIRKPVTLYILAIDVFLESLVVGCYYGAICLLFEHLKSIRNHFKLFFKVGHVILRSLSVTCCCCQKIARLQSFLFIYKTLKSIFCILLFNQMSRTKPCFRYRIQIFRYLFFWEPIVLKYLHLSLSLRANANCNLRPIKIWLVVQPRISESLVLAICAAIFGLAAALHRGYCS